MAAASSSKKGEVQEVQTLMRSQDVQKDPVKYKDAIKKLLGYMTMGIDMSPLFSEMIMATNTRDVVQKKMVYLYLCNYAEQNSDIAILVINTLVKDCRDQNPLIRGLALRSMCSLRVPNLCEYAHVPVENGLADVNAYVRRNAVIGCAKLSHYPGNRIHASNIVNRLYEHVRDKDAQVAASAIHALEEILRTEGGIAVNKAMITHLLNRLKDFTEWDQCLVLRILLRYTPESEDEIFDIMNLLDDYLRSVNSAVSMSVVNAFLHLTSTMPEIQKDVLMRIKSPIMSLLSRACPELEHIALSHAKLVSMKDRTIFADMYKQFYCKFNDPLYVKENKLEFLTMIADEKNARDIVSELGEYVVDVDLNMAKWAIIAIGKVSIQVPAVIDICLESLLGFLKLEVEHAISSTILVMKDVLRKYPAKANTVIPHVQKHLTSVEDPEAKAAVVWMIGEFGELIASAPYILEELIDKFADLPQAVKLQLLTSTVQLFFKRPPEVHKMMGRLLARSVDDVHVGMSLLYLRLLKQDVRLAAKVINPKKGITESFPGVLSADVFDIIFDEFNTLSVVYNMPSDKFTKFLIHEENLPTVGSKSQDMSAVGGDTNQSKLIDLDNSSEIAQTTIQLHHLNQLISKLNGLKFEATDIPPVVLSEFESSCAKIGIKVLASGAVEDDVKYFMYCRADGHWTLFEILVSFSETSVSGIAKSESKDVSAVMELLYDTVLHKRYSS